MNALSLMLPLALFTSPLDLEQTTQGSTPSLSRLWRSVTPTAIMAQVDAAHRTDDANEVFCLHVQQAHQQRRAEVHEALDMLEQRAATRTQQRQLSGLERRRDQIDHEASELCTQSDPKREALNARLTRLQHEIDQLASSWGDEGC